MATERHRSDTDPGDTDPAGRDLDAGAEPHPDEGGGAERFVPRSRSLRTLGAAAESCHGCELYRNATQTVFGSGPRTARVLLLGEQPGDQEDRLGEPFVGPAGHLLDRALAEAGLPERDVYRTNAVKHFRWRPPPGGGRRRIHQSPTQGQITACRPWLLAEVEAVRPAVIVALGASAGKSLFGPSFRVGDARGSVRTWSAEPEAASAAGIAVMTTIHPSAVLRADDREAAFDGFVADLRRAAEVLK
ncbi:MAG: UdgX family uracil-DNA binding protein [Catenulispora sp.]|nr:UdgX family uracil-DNA binding protein [Catenulispora sp.]